MNIETTNRKYAYWLLTNPILTSAQKRKLSEHFNGSFSLYFASDKDLNNSQIFHNLDEIDRYNRQKEKWRIDDEYFKFLETGYDFLTIEDEDYPDSLMNIHDKPYGFYINGSFPKANSRCIAMVGARMPSIYGKNMATELAKELGRFGYIVVSGMAKGIDAFSHVGCMDAGGKTIAVLGCGVDVIYPKANAAIYERIVDNGCIISEYPMGTAPVATNFPARNRIISGLSKKIIVVEARRKSGSLITADFALSQGRDLYAVPGRMNDSLSLGCNELIYQGAGIITSVEDFMKDLTDIADSMYKGVAESLPNTNSLAREEAIVYSCLDLYPKSIEDILSEAKLDFLAVLAAIAGLTRLGIIREVFKNYYIRLG